MEYTPNAGGQPFSRRFIDRRMRQLAIEPLDQPRRVVRFGLLCVAAFLLLLLVFSLVVPISGAAITAGQVIAGGDTLVVQPLEPGRIKRVLVHEGQAVRAGQPLITLDPLRSDAQLGQAQGRYDALLAREARLAAESGQATSITFPSELTTRAGDARIGTLLAAERAEFRRHQAVLAAERRIAASQIVTTRAQAVATVREQALIGDELASYRQLYDEGFARKTTVRSLERNAAQIEADRAGTAGAALQAAVQAQRTRDAQALDAATQLDQVRQQLVQLTPQLGIAREVADRAVLRAPADGRVSGLQQLGPDMAVAGGRTLLELVATGRPLIIEVQVKPQDIDDVRVGQPATIRFSSVNKHGRTAFPGHVITLSPNRVGGETGTFYRARITFDDPVAARRDGLVVQPGIPASANIKTQDRSLFEYLFFPLTDAVSRAFRGE